MAPGAPYRVLSAPGCSSALLLWPSCSPTGRQLGYSESNRHVTDLNEEYVNEIQRPSPPGTSPVSTTSRAISRSLTLRACETRFSTSKARSSGTL